MMPPVRSPVPPVPDGSVPGVVSAAVRGVGLVARGVVVVTAAGGDDRPEERHRQADDRAPADEVTTIDAAFGVRLDQVELLWADRARARSKGFQSMLSPLFRLAGARAGLHPGRPNPNGGLPHGQPPFPVRVYRKWHHGGHGSVRGRPGAEGGRRPRRVPTRSPSSWPNGARARRSSSSTSRPSPTATSTASRRPSPPLSPLGTSRRPSSGTWCRPPNRTRRRSTRRPNWCGRGRGDRDRHRRRQRRSTPPSRPRSSAPATIGVEPYRSCANPLPGHRPMIAIPTTAGTGAEVTRTCIVTDRDGRKVWTWGDEMLPDLVVLDPASTVTMPARSHGRHRPRRVRARPRGVQRAASQHGRS